MLVIILKLKKIITLIIIITLNEKYFYLQLYLNKTYT